MERNAEFFESAASGDLGKIKILLQEGADLHAEHDRACRWAAKNGQLEVVKYLHRFGANLEDSDSLYWAIASEQIEVIKYILQAGVKVEGDSLFYWAVERGEVEIVEMLVQKGADIHMNGEGPLMMAARYGHSELVCYLLEKGADLHAEEDNAFRLALMYDQIRVARLLIERGACCYVLTTFTVEQLNESIIFSMIFFKVYHKTFTIKQLDGVMVEKNLLLLPRENIFHVEDVYQIFNGSNLERRWSRKKSSLLRKLTRKIFSRLEILLYHFYYRPSGPGFYTAIDQNEEAAVSTKVC